MTAKVQDVLKTNLVLVGVGLLNNLEELEKFDHAVNSELMIEGGGMMVNATGIVPEPMRAITIPKDRVSLELSPSRSVISRDYPSRNDLSRVAEVAAKAICSTDLKAPSLAGFGFNIDLMYDQDSGDTAFGYLAKRMFSPDLSMNEGWNLVGGAGRLLFNRGGNVWTVNVEPRLGDQNTHRVFMKLNLHINDREIPDGERIRRFLEEIWDQAHIMVDMIDGHANN